MDQNKKAQAKVHEKTKAALQDKCKLCQPPPGRLCPDPLHKELTEEIGPAVKIPGITVNPEN